MLLLLLFTLNSSLCTQNQPTKNFLNITLKDSRLIFVTYLGTLVYIPFGIIEVIPCFRIDPSDGADHFGPEEDIFCGYNFEQQIDARLMVHAGVEIHIVQLQLL